MSSFQIEYQKKHLHFLQQKLRHIESCDCLMENDPAFYSEQKNTYTEEYAVLLSQLAHGVFEKQTVTPNARLIGKMPY